MRIQRILSQGRMSLLAVSWGPADESGLRVESLPIGCRSRRPLSSTEGVFFLLCRTMLYCIVLPNRRP